MSHECTKEVIHRSFLVSKSEDLVPKGSLNVRFWPKQLKVVLEDSANVQPSTGSGGRQVSCQKGPKLGPAWTVASRASRRWWWRVVCVDATGLGAALFTPFNMCNTQSTQIKGKSVCRTGGAV